MSTINLDDVVPYIEVIKQGMPNDRLIRAGEAARILGVSKLLNQKPTVGSAIKLSASGGFTK